MSRVPIRAAIFDWGNVLMRTFSRAGRIAWDDRLGLPHGSIERAVHNNSSWVQAQCGEITPADYWQHVAADLGISRDEAHQLAFDFYRGDVLDFATVDILHELRAAGIRTALLSNFSIELRPLIEGLHLAPFFEVCAISAEIGVMKPQAEAYLYVVKALGIEPGQAVFIDDRAENIAGAEHTGLASVLYMGAGPLRRALRALELPIAGAAAADYN